MLRNSTSALGLDKMIDEKRDAKTMSERVVHIEVCFYICFDVCCWYRYVMQIVRGDCMIGAEFEVHVF